MRFALALVATTLLARACGDAVGQRTQLSLQVDPQSEVCFFEPLQAGDSAEATVLVYRGGKLDIGLRIEGPPAPFNFGDVLDRLRAVIDGLADAARQDSVLGRSSIVRGPVDPFSSRYIP